MPPLLEREAALAALTADLDAARRGEGRTVLVSGEAGTGKTSLVERFIGEATIGHRLWGACESLSTPQPLGPLNDLVRDSRGALHTLLAEGRDRAQVFAALLDELSITPSPAVLVLEDIHWADAATLDLVKFIGRRIHRVPALMILTYRDDELNSTHLLRSILGHLPARHASRIAVPRLSPSAVSRLAADARRSDVGLHEATGGNAFFVTEILASAERGVPASVSDAVLGRMAPLGAEAREVLELAAIVPRAVETALISRVLQPSTSALDECIGIGLLSVEGRNLRFRHELARVAVEEAIPHARAMALHARVLAALSAPDNGEVSLARLVHHAHRAEDRDAVLRLAPQAARDAAMRGARREAAAHCRIALAFGQALPDAERAALLEEYASHCFELSDLDAAIPAREHAIALFEKIGDRSRWSASLARQAMPLVRALRNSDADAASRRAIEIAETLPEGPTLAIACATEAYLRMLNRDIRDAIAWGERAIALAERFDRNDTLAMAHNVVGAATMFVDYARGCEHVLTSLRLSRELVGGDAGVADAYVMLGTASGELYELDAAERYLDEGTAFARAHDLDRLGGYMEAWQAIVDLHRGRWDAAGDRATAVLAREVAGSTNRLMALVALGRLRIRRGDPGAEDVLDEALALAEQSGTLQRVARVRCTRAEAAWLRGDLDALRREASAAYELARSKGHIWFVGELAHWLWRAGVPDTSRPTCAQAFALQIDGRWRDAAAIWERLGCPYEQACALADGDESAQRAALEIFDRLGARPMVERLRLRMRERGIQAIPRGPRDSTRAHPAGLTAREVEVLELVARGWQNARIAAQMSRSVRTVEHHIAAILAKLGVASRSEAVTAARARGLLPKDR